MSEDQVWDEFYKFYQMQRYKKLDEAMYYQTVVENSKPAPQPVPQMIAVPRMKSLHDLMKDFLSDGSDGHSCSTNTEMPKYFYYEGKEYVLNF
jgi:hypothetical protein